MQDDGNTDSTFFSFINLYGELTVSTIDELPRGRQPVTTYLVDEKHLDQVYQHMAAELAVGHQVYYVLPLIESSEHIENVEDADLRA